MSDRNRRPSSGRQPVPQSRGKGANPAPGKGAASSKTGGDGAASAGGPRPSGTGGGRPPAHSPSGTTRAGRREFERHRPPQPATPTLIDQLRKPFLVSFLVFVLVAVGIALYAQAASPAYACETVDTVQSPAPGELGQVQPDQGNQHVQTGDKVQYGTCPPASGKHINQQGSGPIQPKVYGPNDQAVPNEWVHNLEHGGLVLLYSCDKGACDSASLAALQTFSDQFPTSPVCGLKPGFVSPVIARFEQMPTKYAALLWDRVLYLNSLDTQTIDQYFLRYGERLASDGKLIAPPEPQCSAPSAPPAASSSPAPSGS
ncbi:MAG TPA: DUF3105 domain-containing protein [Candidatus Limnocylindrales bacterium]